MLEAKVTLEQPPQGLVPFLRAIAVALSRLVAGIFGFARDTIARGIIRVGIPPNAVTLAGPVVVSMVFIPVHAGNQKLAGLVLIAAGALALPDGGGGRPSRGSTTVGGVL